MTFVIQHFEYKYTNYAALKMDRNNIDTVLYLFK